VGSAAFDAIADKLPGILGALASILFVGASYFILTLDRQRANSTSKDDTQVGIKLVLYGLILAGIVMASTGVSGLLSYMLGGFKGGSLAIKMSMPPIIVGAISVLIVSKALLPRTNAEIHKQPERYLLGALGIQFGVMALVDFGGFVNGLFLDVPWALNSSNLAGVAVAGAIGFIAIKRLGTLSGWTTPAPPPAPPMQQPPQGYPPQGGGYPPQGGGYPPQGGGYPPQGGGYPPQGGGYPPQGGGYPPQGGYGR
jgi:hypothetical protein